MKYLVLAAACLALSMSVASAGSKGNGTDATADSTSSSNSASGAAAQAALQVNNTYESGGTTTVNGETTLKNVPAVSAPSVFGGGHPCLAGKSGGIAVAGFGGSYGEGQAETVCMLYVMGQPEAAIRALVMTDRVACRALSNVGYYRVGDSIVPFDCGDTVAGGIDTPGVTSKRSKVSSRSAALNEPTAPSR